MPPRKRAATKDAAANDDARAAALGAFVAAAGRKEPGSVFTFNGVALKAPAIPTGALSLDIALGVGGLPRGKIVEIFGPESAGKTSLALSVAAQAIKAGGMGALIDAEHSIEESHLKAMGVDPNYFAVNQPSSGEDAFSKLESMLEADLFDVIIVDSVAMLTPEAELNGEMTDMQVGAQARMMAKGLRKLTGMIGHSKAVVIFINQLRMKVGQVYGNPEDTPGGRALKFAASVRLDVRAPASEQIKDPNDSKTSIGLTTKVTVKKNKVAPPQQKAEYRLIWGKGIDFASSVYPVARSLGVLEVDGGHKHTIVSTGEVITGPDGTALRGAPKVQDRLSQDPALAEQLAGMCYAILNDPGASDPSDNPIPDADFNDAAELAALAND